jgi:hypothetical protein
MRPFGVNPILKLCGLVTKRIISYHLGQGVTYNIKVIAQLEIWGSVHKPTRVTSEDAR